MAQLSMGVRAVGIVDEQDWRGGVAAKRAMEFIISF
jgi:hypothetical protein